MCRSSATANDEIREVSSALDTNLNPHSSFLDEFHLYSALQGDIGLMIMGVGSYLYGRIERHVENRVIAVLRSLPVYLEVDFLLKARWRECDNPVDVISLCCGLEIP